MVNATSTTAAQDADFSELVVQHRPALLRLARRLTHGDTHLAEDVVQTALARLYLAWPTLRERECAAAYARRCVTTAYLDETRRGWRREHPVDWSVDPSSDQAAPGDPYEPVEHEVDGAPVRRAVAMLPPRMRSVVVLRHWYDLDVESTAARLGCSPGTVKSQNARGLQRIEALLAAS